MGIADLKTPCALVDLDVVERNTARMAERMAGLGVRLRPHVKTHKCVEAARLQDALALTDELAADWSAIGEGSPDELASTLGQDLRLRSEQGDDAGDRLYEALQRLSISAGDAALVAAEALASLRRGRP